MDVLIANLKCQIASLETQLSCATQEKQKLYDTVVCLSKILSGCNQNVNSNSLDQCSFKTSAVALGNADHVSMTNPTRALQTALCVDPNSVPEPAYNSQPSIITQGQGEDEQASGPLDLIELDNPVPKIASLHVSSSVPRPASLNALENGVDILPAESVAVSFNTGTAKVLANIAVAQPQASADNMPPILDLRFKGLRTALDGPERSTTRMNSVGSHDSSPTLSFDEIYGRVSITSQDKSVIGSETGQFTNTAAGSPNHDAKAWGKCMSNVDTSNANSGPTNLFDLIRRSPLSSQESSSAQSNDSHREPLSLSHGIRFHPKDDNNFSTRTRVMLFNLPKDILAATILSKIRGGVIISCTILDTVFAYSSPSAMIRFSTHSEAAFCVDHATTTPLVFAGQKALAQLVPTPSYPLAPEIYQNIVEHGHTRCLRINGFQRIKHSHVFRKYSNPQYIEYQAINDCGDWFVRFTSLRWASALWADLQYFRVANLGGGFMPDPCDVEESVDLAAWKTKSIQVMEGGRPDWKV